MIEYRLGPQKRAETLRFLWEFFQNFPTPSLAKILPYLQKTRLFLKNHHVYPRRDWGTKHASKYKGRITVPRVNFLIFFATIRGVTRGGKQLNIRTLLKKNHNLQNARSCESKIESKWTQRTEVYLVFFSNFSTPIVVPKNDTKCPRSAVNKKIICPKRGQLRQPPCGQNVQEGWGYFW